MSATAQEEAAHVSVRIGQHSFWKRALFACSALDRLPVAITRRRGANGRIHSSYQYA